MKLAIIPARGGSQRIPRKNIRHFHGRPIIEYSISLAQRCSLKVYVSTEDAEIAQIAKDYGAAVIQRPFELARDEVGTQEVMRHALQSLGLRYGRAACIYPCAPLLDPEYIKAGEDCKRYAVAVGTRPLRDCGAFYWGRVQDFINRVPLYTADTRIIPLHEDDAVDINTEEDWVLAEHRYALKRRLLSEIRIALP